MFLQPISIVVITIVVIILIIAHSSKEHFNNNKSKDELLTERCDILYNTALNSQTQAIANNNLQTNRIKKFKPKWTNGLNKQTDYCYINDDLSNENYDFVLNKETCSKSSALFKDSDFIRNVRTDNLLVNTKNNSIEKCVLEIDKTKVTPEALQTFWNNFDNNKCIKLNDQLFKDHDSLLAELVKLRSKLEELDISKTAVNDKLSIAQNKQEELKNTNETLLSEIRQYQTTLNVIANEIIALQQSIHHSKEDCETKRINKTAEINKCNDDLKKKNEELDSLKAENAVYNTQTQNIKNELKDIKERSIEENAKYLTLDKTYNSLLAAFRQKTSIFTTCKKGVEALLAKIADRSTVKGVEDDSHKKLTEQLAKCQTDLKLCKENLNECGSRLDRLGAAIENMSKITKIHDDCQSDYFKRYDICKGLLVKVNSEIKLAQQDFEYIMKALPYLTCKNQREAEKTMQANVTKLKEEIVQINNKVASARKHIDNDLKACQNVMDNRVDGMISLDVNRHMFGCQFPGDCNGDRVCKRLNPNATVDKTFPIYNMAEGIPGANPYPYGVAFACQYKGNKFDKAKAAKDNVFWDGIWANFQNTRDIRRGQGYVQNCVGEKRENNYLSAMCLSTKDNNVWGPHYKSHTIDLGQCPRSVDFNGANLTC